MLKPVPGALKHAVLLQAALAGVTSVTTALAMPVAAQTALNPARAASVPPMAAAAPPAVAVLPPAAAASGARQPQRAASQSVPKAAAVAPALSTDATRPTPPATPGAASAGVTAMFASARWIALDVGHQPGGGSRAASGVAEHNFNLRAAAALEAQLQRHGIRVRRLSTTLSLAHRARAAHGAALVVSIHHDGTASAAPTAVATGAGSAKRAVVASGGSGFQLRVGQAEPTACARAVATQLQLAGRHFSTAGAGAWADRPLGVRAGGEGALLQQADVPVLQVSLADIGNPTEERLANSQTWVERQAVAIAKGLGLCLQRPASGSAPAVPPAAAAPATRRA